MYHRITGKQTRTTTQILDYFRVGDQPSAAPFVPRILAVLL